MKEGLEADHVKRCQEEMSEMREGFEANYVKSIR